MLRSLVELDGIWMPAPTCGVLAVKSVYVDIVGDGGGGLLLPDLWFARRL